MKPYARMAPYFGAIFPCSPEHRDCYDRELPAAQGRKVLDVGYGTGEHLAHLARRGAEIYGAEVERPLVEFARDRFPGSEDHFKKCRMQSVASCFKGLRFDLVLLVGNTLPHAATLDEASSAVRELSRVAAAEGKAIVSVVNYDRVMARRIDSLPLIEGRTEDGRAYKFFRWYDLEKVPGKVAFRTRLETPDGIVEGEHELLPIQKRDLADMLTAAFAEVAVWGGYRREPWSLDSFSTVAIACCPRPCERRPQ